MKNKGFVLMETIVVIVVVSVTLLTIFSSYNKILGKLKKENRYDTSEYIYITSYIKKYLKGQGYEPSVSDTVNIINSDLVNDNIKKLYGIKKIYIVKPKEIDDYTQFDGYMIDYLKRLDNTDYIIAIEYKKVAKDENGEDKYFYNHKGDENAKLYDTYVASLEW